MKGNLIAHLHTRTVWVWDKENDQMVTVRLLIGKDKKQDLLCFSNAFEDTEKQLPKVQA